MPFTTAGRYDMTTGAHTERIDTASIDLRHERVGGITDVGEKPILRPLALKGRGEMVHQFIDETLRVFGANTHSKALRLYFYALSDQHPVRIMRRMPDS